MRTGPTPLSNVMRRLMTGYAVIFNRRHKRSGHLFQNRYKSIVCEEDPYLLELIRYIHLNPLRAGLVKDLRELDKYPWTGHSAILGKRKNPLILNSLDKNLRRKRIGIHHFHLGSDEGQKNHPDPVNPVQEKKSLAEKTLEDILLHFGDTVKVSRRRYRQFAKNGIDQGTRPEFQGGGLVRSAGGNKAGLLGRKKEEHEKGDERILGSGKFVEDILAESNEFFEIKIRNRIPLEELIQRVTAVAAVEMDELRSSKRNEKIVRARAIISFLAVDQLGISASEVARDLNMTGMGVGKCVDRAKKTFDRQQIIREYLT